MIECEVCGGGASAEAPLPCVNARKDGMVLQGPPGDCPHQDWHAEYVEAWEKAQSQAKIDAILKDAREDPYATARMSTISEPATMPINSPSEVEGELAEVDAGHAPPVRVNPAAQESAEHAMLESIDAVDKAIQETLARNVATAARTEDAGHAPPVIAPAQSTTDEVPTYVDNGFGVTVAHYTAPNTFLRGEMTNPLETRQSLCLEVAELMAEQYAYRAGVDTEHSPADISLRLVEIHARLRALREGS